MLEKLKSFVTQNVHIVDVLFSSIYLFGWFRNAEQTIKYDLDKLLQFYGLVRAYVLGGRINDSINNSSKGDMPK